MSLIIAILHEGADALENLKIICMADIDYVPLPRPKDSPPLTYSQIVSIEPRITEILTALKPSRDYRKRHRQYSETKRELGKLVGWGAEQLDLRTCQAYDVILDIVIEKLNM